MAVTADKVVVELELRDGQYLSRVRANERAFTQAQGRVAQSAEVTERRVRAASSGISSALRGAAAGIAAGVSVAAITNLADGYTRFTNQLKVAGLEGSALGRTQEQLFQIAQKYGTELESLGTLYGRLSGSAKELGADNAELLRFTEAVSAAVKIQGGNASQASGALLQLSQALGGGTVRAEEFNSILEGARPIVQAVADNLDGYGGSVSRLKADVDAGKVSSQAFFDALLKAFPQLEAQAAKSTLTISASFQTLNNALGKYIGEADESLSATQRLSAGIKGIADNLDTIIPAITIITGLFAARYAASLVTAGLATDGFITKGKLAVANTIADERAKTAAVAAGTRARVAAYTAESIALRAQVDTGRNAAGQFVSRARSAEALAVANRNLAASIGPATVATVRNTGAMTAAVGSTRLLGSGLVALAGGPLGVAALAVTALSAAIIILGDRMRAVGVVSNDAARANTALTKATEAYTEAANAAAIASGRGAAASKAAAAEARALAIAARDAARGELAQAQATIARINAQAAAQLELERRAPIRGDRPGSVRTIGRDARQELANAEATATATQAAITEANAAIAAAETAIKARATAEEAAGGGSGSGGSSGRSGPTAEQIRRRAEDVAADEARAIAEGRNDADTIRRLERENEIRTRQRDIIDAGTEGLIQARTVQQALTEATEAQERIDAARLEGQRKLVEANDLERNIALATLDENTDWLKTLERRRELQELINFYQGQEYDLVTATAAAESDLQEIEKARADASARRLTEAEREDALTIARISAVTRADRQRVKDLEDQEEVLRRIAEYTSADGGNLSKADAQTRARREVGAIRTAEDNAEYREQGQAIAGSFIDIIRSENIGEEIGNRFREAAFDGLQQILGNLFANILSQQGGGGLGSFLSSAFGGGRALGGPVRAGFTYDVGENGREKFVAPANGYIIPNMGAQARSGAGTQKIEVRQTFSFEGTTGDAALDARMRAYVREGQRQTLAIVKASAPAERLETQLLKD